MWLFGGTASFPSDGLSWFKCSNVTEQWGPLALKTLISCRSMEVPHVVSTGNTLDNWHEFTSTSGRHHHETAWTTTLTSP